MVSCLDARRTSRQRRTMMAAMVIGLVQIMMGIEALQAVVNVIKK